MDGKADYSVLIDAETWAFIKRTAAWYPDDTVDKTVAEQRDIYDAMCREFFTGYPDGVTATNRSIDAGAHQIPIRCYRKAASESGAQIVFYHGGGFVVGGLESHDDVCAELCDRTGFPVTSIDYRMSPEHPFPACFTDAMAGLRWATANSDLPIVVVGDSAGGNLTAAVNHAVRKEARQPIGQVLIYPGLSGDFDNGSYVTHAEAPLLNRRDLEFYRSIRSPEIDVTGDPRAAPLADTDFSGLPPTVIISAECDPISDDGRHYRDAIIAAGGKAVWTNEKGLVHGYLRARHTVKRARDSFTRIVDAVSSLGRGQWPYGSIGD